MKAIIIAAGMGNRLGELTRELPKCLLPVEGKPLIEHQVDALAANGITDIVLIKGFQAEKLDYPQFRTYLNADYRHNNVLGSLMHAEREMDGPFIAAHSDILYEADVVARLIASSGDIAIVVDEDWKKKYVGRTLHPESEADKVALDASGRVLEVGKTLRGHAEVAGEFIGLIKCSAAGARTFREGYHDAKRRFAGAAFFSSARFERAYTTDFMNYLVSSGVPIEGVLIRDGWMEIDTEQDLRNARAWITTRPALRGR